MKNRVITISREFGSGGHDTGALLSQGGDDLILMGPENILVGGAEHPGGEGRGEEAAGGVLAGLLHIVRGKAGLLLHLLNQLGIIAGDTQRRSTASVTSPRRSA